MAILPHRHFWGTKYVNHIFKRKKSNISNSTETIFHWLNHEKQKSCTGCIVGERILSKYQSLYLRPDIRTQ